jgi:hypothetical protein
MIASRRLPDDDIRLDWRQTLELLGSILLQKTHTSARKRAIQFINLGGVVIGPRGAQGAFGHIPGSVLSAGSIARTDRLPP